MLSAASFLTQGLRFSPEFSAGAPCDPAAPSFFLAVIGSSLFMALFLYFFDFPQDHEPYGYVPDLLFKSREGPEHNQVVVLLECFHCFRATLLHLGKDLFGSISNDAGNWNFF